MIFPLLQETLGENAMAGRDYFYSLL